MKVKINIKSIIFMAIISIASMLFINISFAINTGKIATETARIREEANVDAKVLELVSQGEKVEIIEEVDGWYKVKYKEITGYIRTDLIETEQTDKDENVANDQEQTENTATENTEQQNESVEISTTSEEDTSTEINTTSEQEIVKDGKYKITENVKLKIIPLISAIQINEVNKDTEIQVTEILNNWAKIKTSEGKEGWIRTDKLAKIEEIVQQPEQPEKPEETIMTTEPQVTRTSKTMYVSSQTINLRESASTNSQIVKQLSKNTQVTVLSTENGWCYVEVNGQKGYISESLLSSTKEETSRSATTTRSSTEQDKNNTKTSSTAEQQATNKNANSTTSSNTGSSVVAYARQFLGCKYVYGGTTTKGFDCSGFTQYIYKHFGVTLSRTAAGQYGNGKAVTNLQPGDLVMFGKSGINHVGIYIGGNTFIHAANPSQGVTISNLSTGYYKTNYVGARRIF